MIIITYILYSLKVRIIKKPLKSIGRRDAIITLRLACGVITAAAAAAAAAHARLGRPYCIFVRPIHRMGTRGVSFTMLAHCPSHRSSNVMSSTGRPPKSRGPRHVGFESQTFCRFARSHLR